MTFFWRYDKFNDFDFSTNITNKLFIVKYVLFDNIDVDAKIIAIFDTNLNKRESFDDIIDFNAIVIQNIEFFDVAKSVANKINSTKINKIIESVENEINDEVNNKVINDFENVCENVFDEANNANSLDKNETISFNIKVLKEINLNFIDNNFAHVDEVWYC